jgi:IstB-like ATP binding protein
VSDTPQLLLAHHLKALKLPTFLREYDKLAQQCAAEGVDYPRYLLRLAELELIDRERQMVERRIKEARFPTVKSLAIGYGFTSSKKTTSPVIDPDTGMTSLLVDHHSIPTAPRVNIYSRSDRKRRAWMKRCTPAASSSSRRLW